MSTCKYCNETPIEGMILCVGHIHAIIDSHKPQIKKIPIEKKKRGYRRHRRHRRESLVDKLKTRYPGK